MKTLYLIRHAKSSWKDMSLSDIQRPLNKRGKRDAPVMGGRLRDREVMPDAILSSPAKRARKTAEIIAEEIGYAQKDIIYKEEIYNDGLQGLLGLVTSVNDDNSIIFLVGHNLELTDFAEMLSGKTFTNVPTCGVVCIEFPVEHWQQVAPQCGELIFFDFPKNVQEIE